MIYALVPFPSQYMRTSAYYCACPGVASLLHCIVILFSACSPALPSPWVTVRRKAHTRVDETVATDGAPCSPSTETHALNQLLHTILKSALLLATKEQIARAAASAVFFGGTRSGAAGSTRPRP